MPLLSRQLRRPGHVLRAGARGALVGAVVWTLVEATYARTSLPAVGLLFGALVGVGDGVVAAVPRSRFVGSLLGGVLTAAGAAVGFTKQILFTWVDGAGPAGYWDYVAAEIRHELRFVVLGALINCFGLWLVVRRSAAGDEERPSSALAKGFVTGLSAGTWAAFVLTFEWEMNAGLVMLALAFAGSLLGVVAGATFAGFRRRRLALTVVWCVVFGSLLWFVKNGIAGVRMYWPGNRAFFALIPVVFALGLLEKWTRADRAERVEPA